MPDRKQKPPDDRPQRTMETGRWFGPGRKATVVRARPNNPGGATLYVRPANWRAAPEEDPDYPPLWYRPPLVVLRDVGNVTSRDNLDISIRGYRFHADIQEGQISIETLPAYVEGMVDPSAEWDYFYESGYYDGFPLDVYQIISFYFEDYQEPNEVEAGPIRYVKLFDFTREFRARCGGNTAGASGQILFYSAGTQPESDPATDPLVLQVESIPIAACQDWTPLHPLVRYVAYSGVVDERWAIVEVRG